MQEIEKLVTSIREVLVQVEAAAADVGRGPGGREVALAKTKLQEAEDWALRASNLKNKEYLDLYLGQNDAEKK